MNWAWEKTNIDPRPRNPLTEVGDISHERRLLAMERYNCQGKLSESLLQLSRN
jgi:hypothetical protein